MMTRISTIILLVAGIFLLNVLPAQGQANAHRGLWVGQVTLNEVGEVTVPLDEINIPIAPAPGNPPTPTKDQAHLRLILHVNGAGQVSLLKDVAILDPNAGDVTPNGTELINLIENPSALDYANTDLEFESDVSLVTDERLYGTFPAQPAVRIASAAFDFGDSKATEAVDAVLDAVVDAVANSVNSVQRSALGTLAQRVAAENAAALAGEAAGDEIIAISDAAAAYESFLNSPLVSSSAVDDMVAGMAGAIADAEEAAENLRDKGAFDKAATDPDISFFQDSRGVEMIAGIVAAPDEAAAQNIAATFADVDDEYHRFLAGQIFGDMIEGAATSGAATAVVGGADEAAIRDAVDDDSAVDAGRTEALRTKVSRYDDTRASNAVDLVLEAIIASLVAALPASEDEEAALHTAAIQAGIDALESQVQRFEVPSLVPTSDYSDFIRSEGAFAPQSEVAVGFGDTARVAAAAAAEEAVLDRSSNGFSTLNSVRAAARTGALNALQNIYAAAARAVATEVRLTGGFGAGVSGLTGTVILPANHPTNPFRHRRHPDHTTGFTIKRFITLNFDGEAGDPLERAGYNVNRIAGTYNEEIFGLHKPLGPNPNTNPIGLKVRGRFVLNRISLIDNLNAR